MGATIHHVKVTASLRDPSQSGVDHGTTLDALAEEIRAVVETFYRNNRDTFACVPVVWS
jgi:hypothetical protein